MSRKVLLVVMLSLLFTTTCTGVSKEEFQQAQATQQAINEKILAALSTQLVANTPTPTPTPDTPTPTPTGTPTPTPTPAAPADAPTPAAPNSTYPYPRVTQPRECLRINEETACVPFDDQRGMYAIIHTTTGYNNGLNFRSDIPAGWVVAYAASSCAVHPDGASNQTEYKDAPFLVIIGPWHGSVGCYSAGIHGVPIEWVGFLIEKILPVHQAEVGNYTIQPTYIGTVPSEWRDFIPPGVNLP